MYYYIFRHRLICRPPPLERMMKPLANHALLCCVLSPRKADLLLAIGQQPCHHGQLPWGHPACEHHHGRRDLDCIRTCPDDRGTVTQTKSDNRSVDKSPRYFFMNCFVFLFKTYLAILYINNMLCFLITNYFNLLCYCIC